MSVARRVSVTMVANLSRALITLATLSLLARSLGTSRYGDLQFLIAAGLSARQLLDPGIPNAYFTLISQRRRGPRTLASYFLALVAQALLIFGAVVLLWGAGASRFFVAEPRSLALAAIAAAFCSDALWGGIVNIGESIRRTTVVQTASLVCDAAYLAVVLLLRTRGLLSIGACLLTTSIIYLVCTAAVVVVLLRGELRTAWSAEDANWTELGRYYWQYCRPLALSLLAAAGCNFADTWLLQRWGGSKQQAYFSLGQQLSAAAILATSSMLKVFWKEISEAHHQQDWARLRLMYSTIVRCGFATAIGAAAFTIPLAGDLLGAGFGAQYSAAAIPFAFLMLMPPFVAVTQINTVLFYSTGKVKEHSSISIVAALLGVPISYLLLGPRNGIVPGLALGALGLPLKLLAIQLLVTRLQASVVSRSFDCRFSFGEQVIAVLCPLALAFAAAAAARAVVGIIAGTHPLALGMLSALLYLPALATAFRRWPAILGLRRSDATWLAERYGAKVPGWLGAAVFGSGPVPGIRPV